MKYFKFIAFLYLLFFSTQLIAAQQTVDNGDSGLSARTKINANDAELYSIKADKVTGGTEDNILTLDSSGNLKDSGASVGTDGTISTAAVSGGGGGTVLDDDAPGAAKEVSGYTGSYVDGAEGVENGVLTFWAKLAGTVTNYFGIDTSTDSVVFNKPTTLQPNDIVNAEIADGTIEADKLEATNSPTNGYYPAFDSTTGGVTWSLVTGGTGYTATPTYSDDPCTIGQYSWDASYYYGCESTNQWDRYPVTWASWSNPTPSIPTYSSGAVLAVGNSMNVVFSEACTTGTGWTESLFTVEGSVTGVGNMLLSSGDTTDTWNFTTDVIYQAGETVTLDFASVTDAVESSTGGDLSSIVDGAVTNNSTQGGTCDDCSGSLSLAWHMENIDITTGVPCGCSDGDTTATLNNAVISGTEFSDGSNSLYCANTAGVAHNATFTNVGEADPDIGTVTVDFYITEFGISTELLSVFNAVNDKLSVYMTGADEPNIDIALWYQSSASNVVVYLNTPAEADLSLNTWYTFTGKWRTTGTPNLSAQITGKDEDTDDTELTAFSDNNPIYVGNRDSARTGKFYIDNLKIYNTWE